jgi:hypothetical protein
MLTQDVKKVDAFGFTLLELRSGQLHGYKFDHPS